jgi:rSAM/selenodomain-associated transferase 1
MTPTDICLVLLCRRPQPGVGKQRLAAAIGRADAATVAELLLAAALEDLNGWPGPVALAPSDPDDADWATQLLARECRVVPQPAGNLGERLNAVDRVLRDRNLRRLVFIGSDAPELREGDYAAARDALDEVDVVLGPATDGGVTLMGSAHPWPDLRGLPWSTARLGSTLRAVCVAQGSTVREIAQRSDVDLPADLSRLMRHLEGDSRPARRKLLDWLIEFQTREAGVS